jgi:hypothetical protein
MDAHDKILSAISQKGPVIPAQISKELNINQLFSSAMLAELVERGALRISSVKVGGSPLYYLPGQEDRLQDFHKNLPEKEQRAYNLLKEHKVLGDPELDPLNRVALRQIKDFAKPLAVEVDGQQIIFWKWYLLANEQAEEIIRQKLGMAERAGQKASGHPAPALADEGEATAETYGEGTGTAAGKKPREKPAKKKRAQKSDIDFMQLLNGYFEKNNITVLETSVIKKNTEADFVLLLPSPVGKLKYYCKAKNKQRCSDADLSSAYVKGELRKLPVLFLTTGEFTKRGQEMLADEFRNIVTHRLE